MKHPNHSIEFQTGDLELWSDAHYEQPYGIAVLWTGRILNNNVSNQDQLGVTILHNTLVWLDVTYHCHGDCWIEQTEQTGSRICRLEAIAHAGGGFEGNNYRHYCRTSGHLQIEMSRIEEGKKNREDIIGHQVRVEQLVTERWRLILQAKVNGSGLYWWQQQQQQQQQQ